MADKRLTYVLTANDNASLVFKRVADSAEASNTRIEKSGERATKQLHLLSTAAVALGPAVIPVAAASAGAMLGLGGAATAALLAFKGLSDQWKAGTLQATPLGQQITAINGNLKGLESITATAIAPGLTDGLKKINSLAPLVGQDVEQLATQLGVVASHVGPGLVTLFTRLNPLFVSLGDELIKGSIGFEKWAGSSQSITKFVQYAQKEIPTVEATLLSLAHNIEHIVEGIAPLGGGSLSTIRLFSEALNHIPVGVLQALAPALLALKVASTASAALNNLNIALGKTVVAEESATAATVGLTSALSVGLIPATAGAIGLYYLLGPILDKVAGNAGTLSDQINTLKGATLNAIPGTADFVTNLGREGALSNIAKDNVRALGGALDGLPRNVQPVVSVRDNASAQLQAIKANIDALHNRQIGITTYLQNVILPTLGTPSVTHDSHRAAGGPVSAGTPYIVGEYGPELFMPAASGTIIPNNKGGGAAAGGSVVINVAGSVVSERDLQASMLAALDRARMRRGRSSVLDA